jgi:hypothetical protein
MLRKDRVGKKGGSVLLYIANFIKVRELQQEEPSAYNEYIICELDIAGNVFKVVVCYKPPNSKCEEDKSLFNLIKHVSNGNIIIMGDMNFPNINWHDHTAKGNGKKFLKIVDDCFLQQMILEKLVGKIHWI